MCQIHQMPWSDYCIKIHVSIAGKVIPGKKNQEWLIAVFVLAWRHFLRPADVKDIFDRMQEPKSLGSDYLVKTIKERQTIV